MKYKTIEVTYQNLAEVQATETFTELSDVLYPNDEPAKIVTIKIETDTPWTIQKDVYTTVLNFNAGELCITCRNNQDDICYVSGEGLDAPEQFDGDCMALIREMQIPLSQRELVYLNFTMMRTQMKLHPVVFG
ncbi:TPA: hypothetical protein ACUNCG_000438 [Aeromonas hydrophila]